MSGCGLYCILLIYTMFLWPIITTSCCLLINKSKIVSKVKYFLLSSFVGYVLIIGFTILMNLSKGELVNIGSQLTWTQEVLVWWVQGIGYFLPTVISSYILAKKISKKEANE